MSQHLNKTPNEMLDENITISNTVEWRQVYDNEYKKMSSLDREPIMEVQHHDIYFKGDNVNILVPKNTTATIEQFHFLRNYRLLRKYFYKWRDNTKSFKILNTNEQKTKVNEFITNLKSQQKVSIKSAGSDSLEKSKPSESFKNRFKVQTSIIDMQKEKLKEQSEIIDELKLGIIRENLLKSVENTTVDIREIFSNCSAKVLCEAPLVKTIKEREKIMIKSQKVPKAVRIVHQKSIERRKYREVILERKRCKEEARQKLLKETIEKNKAIEGEERKRNLEIMNEKRKRELEMQKIRQQRKQELEKKIAIAVHFYEKSLYKNCFKKLFRNYERGAENICLAKNMFLHKQKLKFFNAWLEYIDVKYKIKYEMADAHFNVKILKQSIGQWKEFNLDCVRSRQVAEDIYDLRLTINTFTRWHRNVCEQIIIQDRKQQIATKHFERRLLFKHFYQWRYIPVIMQLEKAKEETKRKWREKVWEILPDFRPPESS